MFEGAGAGCQTARRSLVSAVRAVEIPTVLVAIAVYSGYGIWTWFYRDLPVWLWAPLNAVWLTWYGSLQHETIHNHPTRSRRVNGWLACVPLSLWIPYPIYRITHLHHHRHGGRRLTDVDGDPESFYRAPGTVSACGLLRRALFAANCTLAGRITVGPALTLYRFWRLEIGRVMAGESGRRQIWARHLVGITLVFLWTNCVCHIPVAVYAMLAIYPSISLSHLRSFAEHRASPEPSLRTLSVESNSLGGLLFLNNNLHIAHHTHPRLPWYQLPAIWRSMRAAAVHRELVIDCGYLNMAIRYFWRPVISVEHPGFADETDR